MTFKEKLAKRWRRLKKFMNAKVWPRVGDALYWFGEKVYELSNRWENAVLMLLIGLGIGVAAGAYFL